MDTRLKKQNNKKIFQGMDYRQVQKSNSKNRLKLKQQEQKWLKNNQYKNIGWNNVINLFNKIKDFLEAEKIKGLTLEELFLEADRVGNKYLTSQEIREFEGKLAQQVNQIAVIIDEQFPDSEIEIIDFGSKNNKKRKIKGR
jgi:hypothetical protein